MVLAQLRAFSSAKLLSSVDVCCQSICLLTGHKLGNIYSETSKRRDLNSRDFQYGTVLTPLPSQKFSETLRFFCDFRACSDQFRAMSDLY